MGSRAVLRRAGTVGATAIVAAVAVGALGASTASAALSLGSSGPAVSALNMRLAALTYLPRGSASPRFTLRTQSAVLAFQKLNGLVPDGVVGPRTSGALRTARVPRPRLAQAGRRAEVSRRLQLAFLVVDGKVRRTIHVSTGKAGHTTPAGRYRVFRREKMSWSYPYSVWLPWAAYFNGGIAFHGHRSVPVYAASHGCVRIPMPFASEVYTFARLGTPVHVL